MQLHGRRHAVPIQLRWKYSTTWESEPAMQRLARERLERLQIRGRETPIAPALDFERHFLIFSEILQARTLDRRDMYKDVFRAVFGGDEAETFGCIEELYGTGLHGVSFQ